MSAALAPTSVDPPAPLAGDPALTGASRSFSALARDYVALAKPRIVLMVLITVAVGYLLGARGASHPLGLTLALIGTGLVAGGASAWNQYLERDRDRRMRRTHRRPLPAGRVEPLHAAIFGTALAIAGLAMLAAGPHPVAALVALATFALYSFLYTWLKGFTTLNTAVGAIPGALPPVIGWTAATGQFGIEPLSLFLIMFLWQFPHFLAIAWIYRDDYRRAGVHMLPRHDPCGILTGRQSAWHALVLIPASLLPTAIGLAGPVYFAAALLLGTWYFVAAVQFWRNVSDATARRLLRVSFLYLPVVLLLLVLNPLPA